MSDIETLTRSLTQILASLKDAISKGSSSHAALEPQRTRIKKTPEMTYHDFLAKVLSGKPPLPVSAKRTSYRLQEDITLLFQLSNYEQITNKTFELIASKKRINRSAESMRCRYHEHLHKIEEKEMKKIVGYLEKEGLEGYIHFINQELTISKFDPKDKQVQGKRQRPSSLEAQGRKIQRKGTKLKAIPTNCKQLNDVMKMYSKMVNIPIKTLLERLDQVSGDMIALDNYVESKDQRLLWTQEEDEILRKNGQQVQILRKYRGDAIEARKKYLGIN